MVGLAVDRRAEGPGPASRKSLGLGRRCPHFHQRRLQRGARADPELSVGAGQVRLDRAQAHEELSCDLFVRVTGSRELGDSVLGLRKLIRAWTAPGDPRQLGAGLMGPRSRRALLEDRDGLLERLTGRSFLVRPPPGNAEAEERAGALKWQLKAVKVVQCLLKGGKRRRPVALRGGDQTPAPGTDGRRSRIPDRLCGLLVPPDIDTGALELTQTDEGLESVGPQRQRRVVQARREEPVC